MLKNETYFIDSCDDVELGIKRESKLEYRITYDDSKQMQAIVFMIGAYGSSVSMMEFDRQYIAQKFNVIVVNVIYWCFGARIGDEVDYSAKMMFSNEDLDLIKNVLDEIKLDDYDLLDIDSIEYFINKLNTHIKKINNNFQIDITSTLTPPKNEYQNYGIMAAIDHINVLKDIFKKYPNFQKLPKIYGGCSYGGYLALLISKIAPWYVDGVLDNSGEALLLLNYIIGRNLNKPELRIVNQNISIDCYLKTHWNANPNSPYCFKNENYMIRALLNPTHLTIQANKSKNIKYISYHSSTDLMSPVNDKIQLMQIYQTIGYDVEFYLIKDDDIDGRFIKHSNHGGGITMKALFKKELPRLLEQFQGKCFGLKQDSIEYPCGEKTFIFKDKHNKFELEII
ncbi:DUF2920 family protein [Campylobacter peloridis]|uniref:DUF2920 family protein n=1 Tax=Campylobacter peloridis TaxID=488546 RepID=UPI001C73427C|nr:DUF2920 family protein [Campylobacter peloridis]MBX2078621.1 DUF2920 family protein [Campylobacter peloridis]